MFDFDLFTRLIIATIATLICIIIFAIMKILNLENLIGIMIGCYGYQLVDYTIYKIIN